MTTTTRVSNITKDAWVEVSNGLDSVIIDLDLLTATLPEVIIRVDSADPGVGVTEGIRLNRDRWTIELVGLEAADKVYARAVEATTAVIVVKSANGSPLPAVIGPTTKSGSLSVTTATDDPIFASYGSLTETAPASDTASSGLNGRLQRIAQNLTSFFGAKVTAITALATGGVGVIGWLSQIWNELAINGIRLTTQGYASIVSITRPANITAYTAGDVVGGALSITSIGPGGSSPIMITTVQLELDIAAVPVGMTGFRLYLYNVTPPSAVADNGVFTLPAGDRASFLGFIDINSPLALGATCYIENANINKQLKLTGTGLFGYLVTTAGYTPAAVSEAYKLTVHSVAV